MLEGRKTTEELKHFPENIDNLWLLIEYSLQNVRKSEVIK